jgi:hypothetical protein
MKNFALAITVLALCTASFAQNSDAPKAQRPINQQQAVAGTNSFINCTFNFSSGSGNTFLQYCVEDTGNITRIETPQGHELLFNGGGSDGYGVCNQDGGVASYFDYGGFDGNSANWNSPVLLSQTAKSVKIARTTLDGIWTLTQTINQVPATPAIQVVMALKNNTAVSRTAYLLRYADVNVDGNRFNDFSSTRNSAAGWIPTIPFANNFGTGLQLENVGNSHFGFVSGYARTTYHGPDPCNFAGDSSATPIVDTDGSIALVYVDTIGANKTKTTTMIYKGF